MPASPERLRALLDKTMVGRDVAADLAQDPVSRLHRFADPRDREVAGLFAAAIAYGRVAIILQHLDALLDVMGPSPRAYALDFRPGRDAAFFRTFVHRWTRGGDLAALLGRVRALLETHGSLETVLARGIVSDAPDALPALEGFVTALRAPVRGLPRASASLRALLPSPADGSACKRPLLWMRWLTRSGDGVDPGGWTTIPRRLLVVPLDTHVARLSRYLGLSARRTAGLAMAREVTAGLRRLDPEDPLRYDFALCHLGIAGDCPSAPVLAICRRCPLKPACRIWTGSAA